MPLQEAWPPQVSNKQRCGSKWPVREVPAINPGARQRKLKLAQRWRQGSCPCCQLTAGASWGTPGTPCCCTLPKVAVRIVLDDVPQDFVDQQQEDISQTKQEEQDCELRVEATLGAERGVGAIPPSPQQQAHFCFCREESNTSFASLSSLTCRFDNIMIMTFQACQQAPTLPCLWLLGFV